MASERQVAANRCNAREEQRAGNGVWKEAIENAYRHGLSVPMSPRSGVVFKDLLREFAGDSTDAEILELAERAAGAQLDLERVRRVRAATIGPELM